MEMKRERTGDVLGRWEDSEWYHNNGRLSAHIYQDIDDSATASMSAQVTNRGLWARRYVTATPSLLTEVSVLLRDADMEEAVR